MRDASRFMPALTILCVRLPSDFLSDFLLLCLCRVLFDVKTRHFYQLIQMLKVMLRVTAVHRTNMRKQYFLCHKAIRPMVRLIVLPFVYK